MTSIRSFRELEVYVSRPDPYSECQNALLGEELFISTCIPKSGVDAKNWLETPLFPKIDIPKVNVLTMKSPDVKIPYKTTLITTEKLMNSSALESQYGELASKCNEDIRRLKLQGVNYKTENGSFVYFLIIGIIGIIITFFVLRRR